MTFKSIFRPFATIRALKSEVAYLTAMGDAAIRASDYHRADRNSQSALAARYRNECDQLDTAIDAFMFEREQHKADVTAIDVVVREMMSLVPLIANEHDALRDAVEARDETVTSLLTTITELNDELDEVLGGNEDLNDILVQASLFVSRAKDRLATIGITIETGEDGAPAMTIDTDTMLSFVGFSTPA